MTSSENARAWPMRIGASSVEAASGMSPSLRNGVDRVASAPATTWSQWSSMVVPTPTATPPTAATIGFAIARQRR